MDTFVCFILLAEVDEKEPRAVHTEIHEKNLKKRWKCSETKEQRPHFFTPHQPFEAQNLITGVERKKNNKKRQVCLLPDINIDI